MDLCLSCKACKSECPSSVDVAKLKAEFLQHYYDAHGVPLRTRLIANITKVNRLGTLWPALFNFFMKNPVLSGLINRTIGFAPGRSMPLLQKQTLHQWMKGYIRKIQENTFSKGKVYLFNDEFTNFNDTDVGIKAIQLLTKLGYEVVIPAHLQSGRTYLSKGLLRKARRLANENVRLLKDIVSDGAPLIGIEPSAILTYRDEYPELVNSQLREEAERMAKNCFMFDEFFIHESEKGHISEDMFHSENRYILLHGHCQQKAVASTKPTLQMLSFPANYKVEEIPSGCCGMAGSFGYEKEHYAVSMKVGEMVLFPAVRNAEQHTLIAAPGTSCRHQIKDGTQTRAYHPIEILYNALK
jgi:Fe-S oxidoreductase